MIEEVVGIVRELHELQAESGLTGILLRLPPAADCGPMQVHVLELQGKIKKITTVPLIGLGGIHLESDATPSDGAFMGFNFMIEDIVE